jgi:hypothetical protein
VCVYVCLPLSIAHKYVSGAVSVVHTAPAMIRLVTPGTPSCDLCFASVSARVVDVFPLWATWDMGHGTALMLCRVILCYVIQYIGSA